MGLTTKILLIFVVLGAIDIIILLIAKSRAKFKNKEIQKSKKHNIKVLDYDDEELICMVQNNLELEYGYGYGCIDKNVYENMKKTHINIYTLLWFEIEMESGGLGEYLFSLSNVTIEYVKQALKDIEAFELLEEYDKFINENNVIEVIKQINKRSVEEYAQFMDRFDFSNFNNLYKVTNLRMLMADYIRKNIVDFSDLTEEELKILKEIEEENINNS